MPRNNFTIKEHKFHEGTNSIATEIAYWLLFHSVNICVDTIVLGEATTFSKVTSACSYALSPSLCNRQKMCYNASRNLKYHPNTLTKHKKWSKPTMMLTNGKMGAICAK